MNTTLAPLASLEPHSLRPLLEHEAHQWLQHLGWEHGAPAEFVASAARSRRMGGQVLTQDGRPLAYAYYVSQPDKTIVGGAHGLPESESHQGVRRALDATLAELIDEHSVSRIESQLIFFGNEQPARSFEARGFRRYDRAFLAADLLDLRRQLPQPSPRNGQRLLLTRETLRDAAQIVHQSFIGSPEQQMSHCYVSAYNCEAFLESVVTRQACGRLQPEASFLLLEADLPTGVVVISSIGPQAAHVVQISVHPRYQRRGLGSAMLCASVEELLAVGFKRLTLSVSLHNSTAHRWYRKLGFRELKPFSAFAWSREKDGDEPG